MKDFESMDSVTYDQVLNEISKELFSAHNDLDNDRVRLMLWALVSLLFNKNLITKEEYEESVNEATLFFNLLKRRHKLQQNSETEEESADSEV